MQSTVHLFNTALARLGGEQLSPNASPLEQSASGRICENLFPHVLDMTLAAYAWAFATRRKELAALGAGVFELPADCVKPLRLIPSFASPAPLSVVADDANYVLEGRTLRCALPHAVLVYITRVDDPKLWPPYFADALAWGLAGELAAAVNNDAQKQQWCYQNQRIALADAVALEQRDQNPKRKKSKWSAARFGEF